MLWALWLVSVLLPVGSVGGGGESAEGLVGPVVVVLATPVLEDHLGFEDGVCAEQQTPRSERCPAPGLERVLRDSGTPFGLRRAKPQVRGGAATGLLAVAAIRGGVMIDFSIGVSVAGRFPLVRAVGSQDPRGAER